MLFRPQYKQGEHPKCTLWPMAEAHWGVRLVLFIMQKGEWLPVITTSMNAKIMPIFEKSTREWQYNTTKNIKSLIIN